MQTAKALTVSIVAAAIAVTLPSRALVASAALSAPAAPLAAREREATSLDDLSASVPAPEPRDLLLLVMSLAAIALTGRRSK